MMIFRKLQTLAVLSGIDNLHLFKNSYKLNKMKKIYNYFLLTILACIAVCCSEEELLDTSTQAKPGEEVQFGLSLDNGSRTVYGPEGQYENNEGTTVHAFPLYWDDDDEVLVASPQCSRKEAKYKVTPESGQRYAKAMTRVEDYGVQWGNTSTADFYSIYPAKSTTWTSMTESNVTANINIASQQHANIVYDGTNKLYTAADMDNVVMYARTAGVANGQTVNLQYNPYSTILEFELRLAQNTDEQGNLTDWGTVKITSMTLTAPTETAIAGDFSLKFNGENAPVITATGNNSNTIKLDFNTQQVLSQTNQVMKAKMALIPMSDVTSLQGWTIKVDYLDGANVEYSQTKTLNIAKPLIPGDIHQVKLPVFKSTTAWVPDMTKWITQLEDYKNIYLTELSLPGAWYSLGKNEDAYQTAGHTAATLWNAGVRAFAVECRSYTNRKTINIGNNTNSPSRVTVSGLGTNQGGAYTHQSFQESSMKHISGIISSLATQVSNSSEFAVLVLSYADGGSGGHREIDYKYFINGIKNEITESGAQNIVINVDKNTTVKDVLGKLIIKINVDDNIMIGDYKGDMNALISYNPFMKQLASDKFETPLFSKMYWKEWADANKTTTTINKTDFLWCFSSANRTHVNPAEGSTDTYDIPTYAQRQTALRAMISHSKEISAAGTHNIWFYFNIGGTEASSAGADTDAADARNFAKNMNPWLLEVIKLKANGGVDTNGSYTGTKGTLVESSPSPLGIIMFNQCTGDNATYHGADIIKEIVEMNNKFKLKRSSEDPDVVIPPVEEEDPFA